MAVGAWAVSALCLLLSVGSAAACLLLGAQASALQSRVAALEEERELLRRTGTPGALTTWAEPHLERLLREVRS